MPEIRIVSQVTPGFLAESGRPGNGFTRDDGRFVALTSSFDLLYWPGRATYDGHRLHHRVSLYDATLSKLLGVFDRAHYPINVISFHPTQPILAIGTGSYDGGYLYEGDLWLWNWESGEIRSLLGESREVVNCRFVNDKSLALLLRPRHDDEFKEDEEDDFGVCVGLTIEDLRDANDAGYSQPTGDPRLQQLTPIAPQQLGFSVGSSPVQSLFRDTVAEAGRLDEFAPRGRVWDTCWLTNQKIAVVHDECHVEVWTTDGELLLKQEGEGFGVQVVNSPIKPLVHVVRRANFRDHMDDCSTLWWLDDDGLTLAYDFQKGAVISVDRNGNLLCRDPGDTGRRRERVDQILLPNAKNAYSGDLGHYDCFNHYLRLDGGEALYFLRGTPKSSHENKQLCRVLVDGSVETVMPWDTKQSHLMHPIACWGSNNSIIRAYSVYNPHPGKGAKYIEACTPAGGSAWSHEVSALVTSMVMMNNDVLAYALTDGCLGLLDATTGELLYEESIEIDGLPSMITSLASQGRRLAMGTVEGRLVLAEVH